MPSKTGGTKTHVVVNAAIGGGRKPRPTPRPVPSPTPKPTPPPRGRYPGPRIIQGVEEVVKPTGHFIKDEVTIVRICAPDAVTRKDLGRIGVKETALSLPGLRRGPTRGGFPGPRKI